MKATIKKALRRISSTIPPGKCAALSMILILAVLLAADCRRFIVRRVFLSKKLEGINLSGLDYYNTNLEQINLSRARLVKTNLSFSNLRNARLVNTDLRQADLSAADLTGADLRGANLRGAVLSNAVLRKANLVDAYLYEADLGGADMRDVLMVIGAAEGADMIAIGQLQNLGGSVQYTHLRNADLAGAAVSAKWKNFIQQQGVRNFDKIIWVK